MPNLLRGFEQVGPTEAGEADPARHWRCPNRLREIAVQAMVEGTRKDGNSRALKSKSRLAGEALDLQCGDLADCTGHQRSRMNRVGPDLPTQSIYQMINVVLSTWNGRGACTVAR